MEDWQKRYDSAREEWKLANALWAESDRSMARANARVQAAEREISSLYQERIRKVNAWQYD